MFMNRLIEALADMSDDLIDARELRGAQLQRDARLAWSLFLSQCGQLCLEEGRRIRSMITKYPLREPYEKPTVRSICGIRKNSSERGWGICRREPAHPGDCDFSTLQEQEGGVISAVYDD